VACLVDVVVVVVAASLQYVAVVMDASIELNWSWFDGSTKLMMSYRWIISF